MNFTLNQSVVRFLIVSFFALLSCVISKFHFQRIIYFLKLHTASLKWNSDVKFTFIGSKCIQIPWSQLWVWTYFLHQNWNPWIFTYFDEVKPNFIAEFHFIGAFLNICDLGTITFIWQSKLQFKNKTCTLRLGLNFFVCVIIVNKNTVLLIKTWIN